MFGAVTSFFGGRSEVALTKTPVSNLTYYTELRNNRTGGWFSIYREHTNEKDITVNIINYVLDAIIKGKYQDCHALDIGCGDGYLAEQIASALQVRCDSSVTYNAIDLNPKFISETERKLKFLGFNSGEKDGKYRSHIIHGDCFGKALDDYDGKPLIFIISHLAYYTPDLETFMKTIIDKMPYDSVAVFIHESPTTVVSQWREKYSFDIETNAALRISDILRKQDNIDFLETIFPSSLQFPYLDEVDKFRRNDQLVPKDYHDNHQNYLIVKSLMEFLLQCPIEKLRNEGTLKYFLNELTTEVIKNNNQIIIWDVMQIAMKVEKGYFSNLLSVVQEKEPNPRLEEAKQMLSYSSAKGFTPMHWAVHNKREDYVATLIQDDYEIDLLDDNGFSPLLIALSKGYGNIASTLVENGAKISSVRESFLCAFFQINLRDFLKETIGIVTKQFPGCNKIDFKHMLKEDLHLFLEAANSGYLHVQVALAHFYQRGLGVEENMD